MATPPRVAVATATVAGGFPHVAADFMDTPSPVGARRRSAWPSPAEMPGSASPEGGDEDGFAVGGGGPSLDVDAILRSHDHIRRTSPKAGEGAAATILAERDVDAVDAILAEHDRVRRTSPKAGDGAAATILAERRSPRADSSRGCPVRSQCPVRSAVSSRKMATDRVRTANRR